MAVNVLIEFEVVEYILKLFRTGTCFGVLFVL